MADPILRVQNLSVQFQTEAEITRAVDNISFVLERGQVLAIVGESGSGKSVTSLALMGLVPCPPGQITAGEIWFQDEAHPEQPPIDLLAQPPAAMQQYRGSRLSMIFQEPMSSLNPVLTCGYQLVEAIRLHQNLSLSESKRRAIELLQEVELLPSDPILQQQILDQASAKGQTLSDRQVLSQMQEHQQSWLRRYPHELSGGQIQRVMIAMAISCNPAVLIADEPTTALDVTVQARILDLLRELQQQRGMSIIFVTHDLGIVADIADQVAVMYQGKIVEAGPVAALFTKPQHPYTRGLLACRPQPDQQLQYLPTVADFMTTDQAQGDRGTGSDGMQNRALNIVAAAEQQNLRLAQLEGQPPLVTVQNLQVFFPIRSGFGSVKRYVTAVNDVSFHIYPGETLGLVGESGCGKTTLGRTLVCLQASTGGQIRFDGRSLTTLKGKALRRIRQDLQLIFQDPYSSLNPRMTVGALIIEPLRIFAKLSDMRSPQTWRDRAIYLLERVGLAARDLSRYPHEFSGGQRQRICIARALALNPKFIVCDESVSALDVSVQAQVLNLLKELQRDFNLTYLFISHDLSVVKFMSDRIMVMNQGRIEEIGPAEAIYRTPQRDYTRQLIAAIPKGIPATAA